MTVNTSKCSPPCLMCTMLLVSIGVIMIELIHSDYILGEDSRASSITKLFLLNIPDCRIIPLPRFVVGVTHILHWSKALLITLWMGAYDWLSVIIYQASNTALVDYSSQPHGKLRLREVVTCSSVCTGVWIPNPVRLVFSSLHELFLTFLPLLCLTCPYCDTR